MSERMTDERLRDIGLAQRIAFPPPNPISVELYKELVAERKRFDAEGERRIALALEFTAQLQVEKERVDELEGRLRYSGIGGR